jgi:Fe-S-cluster containining protein
MAEDRVEAALLRLRALYAALEREVAATPSFRCEMSARCCRFREAGHRLFLTALEMREMGDAGGPGGEEACPWLRNGLCSNRERRALACRTYFCSDEAGAAAVTERYHREIRRIHDEFGIPYAYDSLGNFLARDPSLGS